GRSLPVPERLARVPAETLRTPPRPSSSLAPAWWPGRAAGQSVARDPPHLLPPKPSLAPARPGLDPDAIPEGVVDQLRGQPGLDGGDQHPSCRRARLLVRGQRGGDEARFPQ